jgi:antirestriction protein ArdC
MADTTTHPEWSALLVDAVTRPGRIAAAYSAFHHYSTGNQLLALFQCFGRGISPGPINTFVGWKEIGRYVRKGEKALTLCMPVTVKRKPREEAEEDDTFTKFIYRPNWFALAQTAGADYVPPPPPGWDESAALAAMNVQRVPFADTNGNVQGYARGRTVAVSPIAFAPHRTLFHELAHVLLGHTGEAGTLSDDDAMPRSLAEAEAESVALLCCESLALGGADYSRGYIQSWLSGETIPERSAQRIFKAADTILKSGQPK